jgi:hypothetical protein
MAMPNPNQDIGNKYNSLVGVLVLVSSLVVMTFMIFEHQTISASYFGICNLIGISVGIVAGIILGIIICADSRK